MSYRYGDWNPPPYGEAPGGGGGGGWRNPCLDCMDRYPDADPCDPAGPCYRPCGNGAGCGGQGGGEGGGGPGGGGGGGGGVDVRAIQGAFALTPWDEYLLNFWKQLAEQSQQYLQALAGLRERLGAELEALPRKKEELEAYLKKQAREAHAADVYASGVPVAGAHELALQRAFEEAGVQATDWARRATMEIAGALQALYTAPLQFANPMGLLRPDIAGIPREMNIAAYLQAWRERMAQQDLLLRLLSMLFGFQPYIPTGGA